ncbi:SGNH/GDSL hydrolase family protein [Streptomyces sp. SL13]|uniref:SGNH/GDSL hydrolase family protein n=1 Tax=Streptantibioticus silvisoli TaxID=2705255 RepID=A0AA90KFK6_9ACTN|nr:SGNH/GDSL hydrolase family protein [Streptantibioticus silvisoli]MDI5969405.1 SGNH/GDSL hydrolase family protein [Streptantibioticus silvisoli]
MVPTAAGATTDAGAGTTGTGTAARPATTGADRVTDPAHTLAPGWATSGDRAVSLAPDTDGLHVMTADSGNAYQWKSVTTLAEPGFASDLWIGNYCLPDRSHAVVVYAPRQFTNTEELMDRGAFTAIVDLDTGAVKKLPVNASLAYFDPSCDTVHHTAAITQLKDGQTRLVTVGTSGAVRSVRTAKGEITSATPVGKDVVAALGNRVVRISANGSATTLATAAGTPFSIHGDSGGGVDFLDHTKTAERVRRVTGGRTATLASGTIGTLGLTTGTGGNLFVTGSPKASAELPRGIRRVKADPDAGLSTTGALAINSAVSPGLPTHLQNPTGSGTTTPDGKITIKATVTSTGRSLGFSTTAGSSSAGQQKASPSLAAPKLSKPSASKGGTSGGAKSDSAAAKAGAVSPKAAGGVSTIDDGRYCSVARNDPSTMALQPTSNQVEWAVDMAVRGDLTSTWLNENGWRASEGLGTVNPQGLFPLPPLNGGGQIPPQVLLGVLAQESNLWQASSHAEPGEFGNPLIGNFYGTNIYPGTSGYDASKIWTIDWDSADCGYGIGQVTDGMRMAGHTKSGETALPAATQRALALDYTVNIAYAARILALKWNELHSSTVTIAMNNDSASAIENWFAAAWDYNSGFNAPGAASNWGLGWYNNPANPLYPVLRHPFLDNNSYSDAAKPQDWPYEEKVMGWAAWPIDTGHSYDDNGNEQSPGDSGYSSAGYTAAWWDTTADRTLIKPPPATFCDTSNACDPNNPPTCETAHSGDPNCDTPHWYHQSVTWKPTCTTTCGHGQIRYVTLRTEPGSANPSPPPCSTSGLASGTVVVDDVPSSTPEPRCPGNTFSDQGSFSFDFPQTPDGYEAREDLQQIGGGFDGHYWFSHGRQPNNWNNDLETTGTWTPASLPTHLYQVKAYMPYLGDKTSTATYQIADGSGNNYTRTVDQGSVTGGWVTVGYYQLTAGATVTLNNITQDTTSGDSTVAYDAMAFVPIAGSWQHHTFDAVSIFSPDQNMDTAAPSWMDSSHLRTRQTLYDWAHSASSAITGMPSCSAPTTTACVGAKTMAAVQSWSSQVEAAGTSISGSATEPNWLAFANPTPNPSVAPGTAFASDLNYKIKTHIDVSFAADPDGKIIPGSNNESTTWKTGNTAIAPFIRNFINGTVSDYGNLGVKLPDLSFTEHDANYADGSDTAVANPLVTGYIPARAYLPWSEPSAIDSTGKCIDTRSISGGADGYRPLGGAASTSANFGAYVTQLQNAEAAGGVPQSVVDLANGIYETFFKSLSLSIVPDSMDGSILYAAPPIWQEATVGFCADGSLVSTQTVPDADDSPGMNLVQQSYMPDLYLYYDNHMVNESGQPSSGPVQSGNFTDFSNMPFINANAGTALDNCDETNRGNGGNPWNISVPPGIVGTVPTSTNYIPDRVTFCDSAASYESANP